MGGGGGGVGAEAKPKPGLNRVEWGTLTPCVMF